MAKIVVLSVPAHGHVNPTLAVVAELIRRGHKVIYYNSEEFREKIQRTACEFRAYPQPPNVHDISPLLNNGSLPRMVVLNLTFTEHVLPFILAELQREQPDILAYDSLALWGMMASRLLDLPSIGLITHFVLDGRQETRPHWHDLLQLLNQVAPLVPELFRLRRRLRGQYGDVFPRGHLFPLRGDLSLVFTSIMLQPKASMIDDTFRFIGPSIDPATRDSDFPFEQLTRKPVVYISLGTLNNRDTAFYRTVFAAFANHPGIFILSVGQYTDITSLGDIPANFMVYNHVPQLEVLQQSDLFITHGGMNSVHEGFYYGVPLVVIPRQTEQVLNGRVVVRSGGGLLLGDRPPYGHVTTKELQQAVDKILSNNAYRRTAETIGDSLRAAGGYKRSADEIEAQINLNSTDSDTLSTTPDVSKL